MSDAKLSPDCRVKEKENNRPKIDTSDLNGHSEKNDEAHRQAQLKLIIDQGCDCTFVYWDEQEL